MNIDEEIKQKINEIILESTTSRHDTSTESDEIQIDELHTTSIIFFNYLINKNTIWSILF